MSRGWVPISKSFLKYLPQDRSFGKLEAVFSLSVDYNEGKMVSVSGYAKLWGWSRKKVRNFLDDLGLEIGYPEDTTRTQKQWGKIQVRKGTEKEQKRNRKAKNREQITFIDFKDLQAHGDRKPGKRGQKRDRSGSSTLNSNKNTYSDTSIELQLSKLLLDLILERRNSFKKPNLQRWALEVHRMIHIDKRQPEEIDKVVRWCQQNNFWRNNILSTKKLRQQFDHLALKMGDEATEKADAWAYIEK